MKKLFFYLTFLTIFSLFLPIYVFSQDTREVRIYVPPISGIGTLDEKTYFYKQLSSEVVTQFHSIVRMKSSSDFILKGRIEPFVCLHDPFIICPLHPRWEQDAGSGETPEYIFYLDLINSKTNEIIGGQYIVYKEIDSAIDEMISVIVFNMLSGFPDFDLEPDRRDRLLFIEPSVMWSPRIYKTDKLESHYLASFGFGASIEIQFVNFMSLNVGFNFTQDKICDSETSNKEYRDNILQIPLSLRFIIKLGDNFMLSPYGGMSYNFSLSETTEPCPYSWFAGLQFAVKAGPGFITIDPRFSMDYYESKLSSDAKSKFEYNRLMLQIGVGYKFGLIQKKKKEDSKESRAEKRKKEK